MLTIKTYLAPDAYGGQGVFAAEPIKAGDVVWQYHEEFTRLITLEEYRSMLAAGGKLAQTLKTYCYPGEIDNEDGSVERVVYHDMDNGSFMNHDDNPNTGYITDPNHPHYADRFEVNIALRDIAKGEPITFDYFDFVDDLSQWQDVETCLQFLFDMGRFEKLSLKKAS